MLRLLVALDFSDCSREALRAALTIADRSGGCELVHFTVVDTTGASSEEAVNAVETAITALHQLVEKELAARGGKSPQGTRMHFAAARGVAADEIIAHASAHQADAIVMGTHGRTGLNRLIAGSVAETVVRLAPCSVLTVRAKK